MMTFVVDAGHPGGIATPSWKGNRDGGNGDGGTATTMVGGVDPPNCSPCIPDSNDADDDGAVKLGVEFDESVVDNSNNLLVD